MIVRLWFRRQVIKSFVFVLKLCTLLYLPLCLGPSSSASVSSEEEFVVFSSSPNRLVVPPSGTVRLLTPRNWLRLDEMSLWLKQNPRSHFNGYGYNGQSETIRISSQATRRRGSIVERPGTDERPREPAETAEAREPESPSVIGKTKTILQLWSHSNFSYLARKSTTSLFSFLIGTMSRRHQNP